jgi:hypothetical protein
MKTSKDQAKQAEELRANNQRPIYKTPDAINKSMDIARMLSLQGLPGQNLALDQLRQTSASGVRAVTDLAQDPAAKAAMAAGLYSQEMNQVNQLNMADAQARTSNLQSLGSAYGILAEYQDKEFGINKMQPYDNAMAAASALTGASMQNKMAATEDIIAGVSAGVSGLAGMGQDIALASKIKKAEARAKESAAGRDGANITQSVNDAIGLGGGGTGVCVGMDTSTQIDGMSDYQIIADPEYIEFKKSFPFASDAELVQKFKKFKVQYGMK